MGNITEEQFILYAVAIWFLASCLYQPILTLIKMNYWHKIFLWPDGYQYFQSWSSIQDFHLVMVAYLTCSKWVQNLFLLWFLSNLIFISNYWKGELLPAASRSFGSGLLGILDNLSLFISAKMVPTWQELFGVHGAFFMYASICSLVTLISYFFMPDTSGMSLEEIEEMYKSKKKPIKSWKK